MASEPATAELKLVLQRFLDLNPREQLQAYRAIRDALAERVRETKNERLVAEKAAAVEALAAVAAHLELAAGQAPTADQFDAAARELDLRCARGLRWDRSRVRRAWGKSCFAKEAFLGQQSRSSRPRARWRKQTHEGSLRAVKLWLATKPPSVIGAAYGSWARQYNDTRPAGEPPVPNTSSAIVAKLNVSWPDVVRLARGEISEAQARRPHKRRVERYCHGPHELVVHDDLMEILGRPSHGTAVENRRDAFPAPVIILGNTRFWLRDDVKAYKAGRRWTTEENERQRDSLRREYLTVEEMEELTALSRDQLNLGRDGLPEPAVKLGFRKLWLRAEVEASPWLRERDGASEPRRRAAGATRRARA